jgi:ribosomal protein S18 acetylase RimI-like enzyme
MKLQKTTNLKNVDLLSKIIFLNFLYLQNEPNITFTMESIINILKSPSVITWFLLDDQDNICGYLIGKNQRLADGRYVYYISYFYITEFYRNKGYGRRMLLTCFKEIKDLNIKFIMLICKKNSSAEKLYKSLGFSLEPIVKLDNENYEILYIYV